MFGMNLTIIIDGLLVENNLELVYESIIDDEGGFRYKEFILSYCPAFNCIENKQIIKICFDFHPKSKSIRIDFYFHDSVFYTNGCEKVSYDDVVSKIKSEIIDKVFKFGYCVDDIKFVPYGGSGGANFVGKLQTDDIQGLEKFWNELDPYYRWVVHGCKSEL